MSEEITHWEVEFTDAEGFSWIRPCILDDGDNPLKAFPEMLTITHYGDRDRSVDIEITGMRKVTK
ncbi:hypothetical protein [Streptomyces sp. NPDC059994]|uniref:hypothetical protein n=1 Tax=Streptomyces sp. NPDC059994 TaxID=3347029 RepID=UPI00367E33AC